MPKTVVLVDALNLVHKSIHSYGNLTTKEKVPTGAIYGMLSQVFSLKNHIKEPYTVIVVWEGGAPSQNGRRVDSWRKALFTDYKANRVINPAVKLAHKQVPYLMEAFDILKMQQVYVPGLEADDLIGILSQSLLDRPATGDIVIFSTDRDFLQLVNDQIKVLQVLKGKSKLVGASDVYKEYGLHPDRFAEYKALVGDNSDNYKSIKGIGPVAAKQLVLDGIRPSYKDYGMHSEALQFKHKDKLKDYWTDVHRCYKLAYIPRKADYPLFPKELRIAAVKELRKALSNLRRTYSLSEVEEAVSRWTRYCAKLELASFLADRRRYFQHLTVS